MAEQHILLVDDDSDALQSLITALRSDGLHSPMHAATRVDRALELFEDLKPHVMIVDLNLDPHLGIESGFSLLQAILLRCRRHICI